MVTPLTIHEQRLLKEKNGWHAQSPISLDRLCAVQVQYIDFNNQLHEEGRLIVLDAVAHRVAKIFEELLKLKFPIEKIKPAHEYGGDDDASMADNNTSSFNCRKVRQNELRFSLHAYGLAIDLNPIQNPYIICQAQSPLILPPMAESFIDREPLQAGMVEPIVSIFIKNGFTVWGGHWQTPIDYQHFQTTRFIANMLAIMLPNDARHFFELSIEYSDQLSIVNEDYYERISSIYKKYSQCFNEVLKEILSSFQFKKTTSWIDQLQKTLS